MTLNKTEWISELEQGYIFRTNQYEFYKRQSEFLKNNFDIQVNQGGMGLGKTFCNSMIMSENIKDFTNIFVATPTITLKHEWSKELNKNILINNRYIEWVSKSKCCGIYHKDVSKCNDDCDHNRELWANRSPKDLCYDLLGRLNFPLDSDEYYQRNGTEYCLRYPILLGLRTKKIIVGDFFGFLNRKSWNYTVAKPTQDSYLIVDEAHLIPARAISYLSRNMRLRKTINELDKLLVGKNNITLENTIQLLRDLLDKLINITKIEKEKSRNYTLNDFCKEYKIVEEQIKLGGRKVYSLPELRSFLLRFGEQDEEKEKETNPAKKFVRFLDFWEEYGDKEDYNPFFSYIKNYKDREEEIELKVVCANPSSYLKNIWKEWGKISLVSGTVDEQYFSQTLGLDNFKVKFEHELKSYGIRDNVIIYSYGCFTSTSRDKTLNEQSTLFNKTIQELESRTLVFVLSKDMAYKVEKLIDKDKTEVINFAKNERNEEISQGEYERLKQEFSLLKKGIGIINILGRVEGQNFLDTDNQPVKNIIIYGYPFQKRGIEFDFVKAYWQKTLINQHRAKEYAEFFPVSSKIYQAVMRAKRHERHNPIIILWSSEFKEGGTPYRYLSEELKGKQISSYELINEIKRRQNGKPST